MLIDFQDVFTVVLFFIPGYIALFFVHIVVGHDSPKNQIEKTIVYVFHSSMSILLYQILIFVTLRTVSFSFSTYSVFDVIFIIISASIWGLAYGSFVEFCDKKGVLPHGLVASGNMFRKFHWKWFKGGWVEIKLKNNEIYRGWLLTAYDKDEDDVHYIGLSDVERINPNGKVLTKKSGYNVMIVDLRNVYTIKYYRKDFKKSIEKY